MAVGRAVLFRLTTSERLEQVVKALPGGDAQAWRAASRYVAGRSRDEALPTTVDLLGHGHGVSVDLFGELVRDRATADRVTTDYLDLAAALPVPPADVWLSLDLSHLAIDTDPAGAADRLATVAAALPSGRRIQVGAEDAARTDAVLGCVLDVAGRGLADRVGATVQAKLLRSEDDVDTLAAAGVHVRLVKGAYLEPTGTLVEVDVQLGDKCLAVASEPVVSIVSGLQCSGGQQPIPQLDAPSPGEVVVAGASFSQRGCVAVLA